MKYTTTWTFLDDFEGWTFIGDEVGNDNSYRSHVEDAIRIRIVIVSGGTVFADNYSPIKLFALISAGDTIEVDISATSDTLNMSTILQAHYTDVTFDSVTSANNNNARTVTLNLTAGKTLDYIFIRFQNTFGGSLDHTRDILEVRLITALPYDNDRDFTTVSKFISDQGGGASGGAGGGFDNIADISADAQYIYICSFNISDNPILIRLSTLLNADGTVVFNPGAGGRIGVRCGRFNASHVWVAGEFDGTNTVEKSENDGGSFTVKDNGSFGTIRTFDIGPDSDNRLLLFDGDNGDILETTDGGDSWTTINGSVSPLINSLARLDINLDEIIAGNQGAANNSINYSPNSGVDLEDYQTGVYPNADATKVIEAK